MTKEAWVAEWFLIHDAVGGNGLGRVRYLLLLCVFAWAASGCLATRSLQDPKERPVQGTAYTLGSLRVQPSVGILGQSDDELGVAASVDVGIGKRGQAGINVAHGALGILSLRGKANIIDKNGWGLGIRGSLLWINPQLIWVLPDKYKDPLGDLRILTIPVRVVGSFNKLPWLGVHVGLGYTYANFFGDFDEGTALFEGSFGTQKVMLDPRVDFLLGGRVVLFVGAELQLWGSARVESTAEREIEEGSILGLRAAGSQRLNFEQGSLGIIGATAKFGGYTYLTFYTYVNGALSRSDVIGSQLIPGISISWRI